MALFESRVHTHSWTIPGFDVSCLTKEPRRMPLRHNVTEATVSSLSTSLSKSIHLLDIVVDTGKKEAKNREWSKHWSMVAVRSRIAKSRQETTLNADSSTHPSTGEVGSLNPPPPSLIG